MMMNRNFLPFCLCDLDLDPMTFIYELDPNINPNRNPNFNPNPMEIYRMCKYKLPTSRLSKVIV